MTCYKVIVGQSDYETDRNSELILVQQIRSDFVSTICNRSIGLNFSQIWAEISVDPRSALDGAIRWLHARYVLELPHFVIHLLIRSVDRKCKESRLAKCAMPLGQSYLQISKDCSILFTRYPKISRLHKVQTLTGLVGDSSRTSITKAKPKTWAFFASE